MGLPAFPSSMTILRPPLARAHIYPHAHACLLHCQWTWGSHTQTPSRPSGSTATTFTGPSITLTSLHSSLRLRYTSCVRYSLFQPAPQSPGSRRLCCDSRLWLPDIPHTWLTRLQRKPSFSLSPSDRNLCIMIFDLRGQLAYPLASLPTLLAGSHSLPCALPELPLFLCYRFPGNF